MKKLTKKENPYGVQTGQIWKAKDKRRIREFVIKEIVSNAKDAQHRIFHIAGLYAVVKYSNGSTAYHSKINLLRFNRYLMPECCTVQLGIQNVRATVPHKIKAKEPKIQFDDYVNMVRSRAHYYARCYHMEYADVEEQGFLIYCISVRDYKKNKASFSTFLYRNLSGRLNDYCKQTAAKEGLDNFDEPFETFIDLWPARESLSPEQFLTYARDYLSPVAFNILRWLLNDQLAGFRTKSNPSLVSLSKTLNITLESLETYWQELSDFWKLRGAAFYASV